VFRRYTGNILLLFFLCSPGLVSAFRLDSLRATLDTATGKNRIDVLAALCYQLHFSYSDSALKYGFMGLDLARKIKYAKGEAHLLNNIGTTYTDKGEHSKALEYFIEAEKIFESLGDQKRVIMTMRNIGIVYEQQELFDKALEYYIEALKLARETDDKTSLAQTYTSLGSLSYSRDDKKKALEYFRESLRIMEELKDLRGIADGLNNVAVVYEELGDYRQAIIYHKLSIHMTRKMKDKKNLAASLHNLGLVYKAQNDLGNAMLYMDSSITLASEIRNYDLLHEFYSTLSEIYKQQKNFPKALEYYQLSVIARDTLINQDRNRQIVEMSAKYETEKKQKENEILTQRIDIQQLNANRQQIIIYAVSALAVLLISLAFFIYRGYRQKKQANIELFEKNLIIEEKSKIVEEKNKDITDSIRYAKRLQEAILKPVKELPAVFPDSFIFFQPKDIVSGDFYWFEKFGNQHLIAAADCTGHGVPGAFMSIIGCNLMSQAVNEYALTKPAVILNSLNKGLSKILHQRMEESVKDGMDIALCAFDPQRMIVEYAGAFNPMWIIRQGELFEYRGDKFPVGAFLGEQLKTFSNQEVQLQKGDSVYLFSDGYADQFGGPKGKKFKYKQLKELLISIQGQPMQEQREILKRRLDEWKGNLEQVDDILVIGVRV
jgi:serine phosphatase RsbU (regulator of sigma subunit)